MFFDSIGQSVCIYIFFFWFDVVAFYYHLPLEETSLELLVRTRVKGENQRQSIDCCTKSSGHVKMSSIIWLKGTLAIEGNDIL